MHDNARGLGHAPQEMLKIDALRLNLRAFQGQNISQINCENHY